MNRDKSSRTSKQPPLLLAYLAGVSTHKTHSSTHKTHSRPSAHLYLHLYLTWILVATKAVVPQSHTTQQTRKRQTIQAKAGAADLTCILRLVAVQAVTELASLCLPRNLHKPLVDVVLWRKKGGAESPSLCVSKECMCACSV